MRITTDQVRVPATLLNVCWGGAMRRGGDIDVYLQASRPIDLKTQLQTQYRLELACDTHVDLLVKNPGQSAQPTHKIAIEQGVLL